MKIESGFTIAQVTITVAITGVLAAVAVQSYQTYIAKAQAAEIGSLLTTQQVNAITDLKNGRCPSDKLFGKFGNVIGSGTFAMSNGASCQTGCELKYQFNTNGVARELQGKTVTVALLNSGEIASVEAKTTLSDKYLKGVVFAKANIIGDSCTAITPTIPKTTAGDSLTGNEVGMAAPVIPDPTPPTPPAGGTTPTTPTPPPETPPVTPPVTPPPPVTNLEIVGTFIKSEAYSGVTYNLMNGANAYDFFVSRIGRAPIAGENIAFSVAANSALIGTSVGTGGIVFDNRFNNVGSISLVNKGIVLGRGKKGRGQTETANQEKLRGGTAILNMSSIPIVITNSNIIAGGGGGGASISGTRNNVSGGDGAPWGNGNTGNSFTALTSSGTNAGGGFPGQGGAWGDYGKQNSQNKYVNYGYPGYVIQGPGLISNTGAGWTKGH